jgi:hypothetical protein
MMARKRLILREEVFGAIKTLTRLKCTNPSVIIDIMDDYLSIYHKASDSQLISFVYEQSLGRGRLEGRKRES